jgi:hypothetical protein
MQPCFSSDEIPRSSYRHVMGPLVAGPTARGMHREWRAAMAKDLAGGLRARVHRSAGEERPDGEATNARTWGPAAFPKRLGGPASRWRRRVRSTSPVRSPTKHYLPVQDPSHAGVPRP